LEFAEQVGVTEDTVINWGVRGKRPARGENQKVMDFRVAILTTTIYGHRMITNHDGRER
jgi:hypothetical protein